MAHSGTVNSSLTLSPTLGIAQSGCDAPGLAISRKGERLLRHEGGAAPSRDFVAMWMDVPCRDTILMADIMSAEQYADRQTRRHMLSRWPRLLRRRPLVSRC